MLHKERPRRVREASREAIVMASTQVGGSGDGQGGLVPYTAEDIRDISFLEMIDESTGAHPQGRGSHRLRFRTPGGALRHVRFGGRHSARTRSGHDRLQLHMRDSGRDTVTSSPGARRRVRHHDLVTNGARSIGSSRRGVNRDQAGARRMRTRSHSKTMDDKPCLGGGHRVRGVCGVVHESVGALSLRQAEPHASLPQGRSALPPRRPEGGAARQRGSKLLKEENANRVPEKITITNIARRNRRTQDRRSNVRNTAGGGRCRQCRTFHE